MKKLSLKVEERKVLGKKVKKLRREGLLPVNIYGKDIKSKALQVPLKDFEKILKEAGETQVIDVSFDSTVYPALIHNVQYEPVTDALLHADFYKVDLTEKIKAMVPVEATGEAKAVTDKKGLLLQTLSEVEVEALPTELPEKIEVDVTALSEVDQQVTVADLKVPAGVAITTDSTQVVFKVGELVTREAEELAKAAEEQTAAAAAAQAPTEAAAPAEGEETPAAEGETKPAEGEQPTEAKKEEPKPKEK